MLKFILTLTVVCAVSLGSTFADSCGTCPSKKDKKEDKTEDTKDASKDSKAKPPKKADS